MHVLTDSLSVPVMPDVVYIARDGGLVAGYVTYTALVYIVLLNRYKSTPKQATIICPEYGYDCNITGRAGSTLEQINLYIQDNARTNIQCGCKRPNFY